EVIAIAVHGPEEIARAVALADLRDAAIGVEGGVDRGIIFGRRGIHLGRGADRGGGLADAVGDLEQPQVMGNSVEVRENEWAPLVALHVVLPGLAAEVDRARGRPFRRGLVEARAGRGLVIPVKKFARRGVALHELERTGPLQCERDGGPAGALDEAPRREAEGDVAGGKIVGVRQALLGSGEPWAILGARVNDLSAVVVGGGGLGSGEAAESDRRGSNRNEADAGPVNRAIRRGSSCHWRAPGVATNS